MAAAAAAADKVLCSKACALQHADKTNTDGMLYVYQTLARFMPKGGGNAQHKLEILMADIKGKVTCSTAAGRTHVHGHMYMSVPAV